MCPFFCGCALPFSNPSWNTELLIIHIGKFLQVFHGQNIISCLTILHLQFSQTYMSMLSIWIDIFLSVYYCIFITVVHYYSWGINFRGFHRQHWTTKFDFSRTGNLPLMCMEYFIDYKTTNLRIHKLTLYLQTTKIDNHENKRIHSSSATIQTLKFISPNDPICL